ncbi:MAG TPA: N-acetyltransferase family protein [Clostridia bacterium]|nr:N-acetyltransferase family protein [Clostridia bacterium]
MAWEIRPATLEDAKQILSIYAPFIENTCITFEYETPSQSDFEARMRGILPVYPYLVCLHDGRIVGYAYASRPKERAAYQWNAELSVYIAPEYHRMGVGAAFYQALTEILILQNIQKLYAVITVPNEKSERFHARMGFRRLCVHEKDGYKFGAWHDVLWMERNIGDHPNPPQPLLPWAELDQARVGAILREAEQCLIHTVE